MAPTVALPNLRGSIQEVTFAQRLADNNKSVRDRALKKLKKFLALKSSRGPGFSDDDALKIWKGLFYCLYMADKPLVQEEVAEEMSVLIHDLENLEDCRTFTRAAFRTFAREWDGIDIYRIDKFMMFVRRVLRQMFMHLRKLGWELKEVAQFVDILDTTIIRADDDLHSVSLGIKLHLCSIIMEELAKIGGEKLKHDVILAVIQPYMKVLALSKVEPYRLAVQNQVFRHLIRQSDVGVTYEQGEPDEGDDEACDTDENDGAINEDEEATDTRTDEDIPAILDPRAGNVDACIPQIYPDFNHLAEVLQNLGSLDQVKKQNRHVIYKMVSELRDVAQGSYPLGLPVDEFDDEENNFVPFGESVQKLQKFNETLMNPIKTNKELEDLKSDPLSNYSIKKAGDKKPKKKKLKKRKKAILTFKEKQAIAKQQKLSEIALRETVEDHLSQITETVKRVRKRKEPSVDDKAVKEKVNKKNRKQRNKEKIADIKLGGFEVSTIAAGTKRVNSKLISDGSQFEISAISDVSSSGVKRKSEIESEVNPKKLRKVPNIEEPVNLGSEKQPKVGKKKQKKKVKKAGVAKACVVEGFNYGKLEDKKFSPIDQNKSSLENKKNEFADGLDENFPKGKTKKIQMLEKRMLNTESTEVNPVGKSNLRNTEIKSLGKSKAKKALLSDTFDIPDFASSLTAVNQEKSVISTEARKDIIKVHSKTGVEKGLTETNKNYKNVIGINAEDIKVKSKDNSNKTETQVNGASAQSANKSTVSKTPTKTNLTKDAGLVMNFAENRAGGSVWSKPIKEGEIEVFIKSRRQLKHEKNNKHIAHLGGKVTPKTSKERTIKINLKQNQEQYIKDYEKSVRNSPQIPFSADKVPKAPVLKPSPSPILLKRPALKILKNVIRKSSPSAQMSSSSLKAKSPKAKAVKRSKASDFF